MLFHHEVMLHLQEKVSPSWFGQHRCTAGKALVLSGSSVKLLYYGGLGGPLELPYQGTCLVLGT